MPTNSKLAEDEKAELRHPPITLDSAQRDVVEKSIREVCDHRGYALHAVNVRTNHVHSVVTASCKPERVMDSFKAYATRRLREARLLGKHGSELFFVHVVPRIDVVPPRAVEGISAALEHVPASHDHDLLRKAAATATER